MKRIECSTFSELLTRKESSLLLLSFPRPILGDGEGVIYINCCSFDLYIFITCTVSLKKQKRFFRITELNVPKLKNYYVHIIQ